MKYYVDLHIHSALSPCADNDMTPNNIVNMASIKDLDIIAVTDHNSVENVEAVLNCGRKMGILVVPGMEIETREEVHTLCYFSSLKNALEMQEIVYASMPLIDNREDIFGEQIIMDERDNVKGRFKRLLITATELSLEEVQFHVYRLGGAMVPAHVDRNSYSIISNLGMIPPEIHVKCIEVSKGCDVKKYIKQIPELGRYKLLRNSDAHTLGDILEKEASLELESKSTEALINYMVRDITT